MKKGEKVWKKGKRTYLNKGPEKNAYKERRKTRIGKKEGRRGVVVEG